MVYIIINAAPCEKMPAPVIKNEDLGMSPLIARP